MHHPFLIGQKVYLRALERSDLNGPMLDWANDPEVTYYMYMGLVPNTLEALEHDYGVLMGSGTSSLLQLPYLPDNIVFAVVDRATDVHTGNIGFFGISWLSRVADLRAIIGNKKYWGGGYAAEAYVLALRYAFDRLNLRRITAGCRVDNLGSILALKRVGFVQEGRQRGQFLRNEQAHDILLFGLLREEFFALFPSELQKPPRIPKAERKAAL